ncbi:MAG: anaerobic glycerol-3-phosphate dehydrogenase subunit A [Deinococcus sp.]|nr:anaerobic glycerol-3-phosphate dehydrogenase subunit A [Deinococcus sp.]
MVSDVLVPAETQVVVVGGGATGAGVAHDLALRGIQVVLLERGDLASGTTGRNHGLWHSGARYVVRDPQAAKECIAENLLVRQLAPMCIEPTGGFFMALDDQDLEYAPQFLAECQACGVPVEEIDVAQALAREPYLNPAVQRVFQVPDAAVDPFRLTVYTARSAQRHGAVIARRAEVTGFVRSGDAVVGVRYVRHREEHTIACQEVVLAAGPWCGKLAQLAGVEVDMAPDKGAMVVFGHRVVNTVVNRCRLPGDGDILVPEGTTCIIGTTSYQVADPDDTSVSAEEAQGLIQAGMELVPALAQVRRYRAYAGSRPIYHWPGAQPGRWLSRATVLIDHAERHGVRGLVTITGGKLTTYRLMAQEASDLVARRLGVNKPCTTHLEPLGEGEELQRPLPEASVICGCEGAGLERVRRAIADTLQEADGKPLDLDDVRRRSRLGMGTCQGAFCGYRALGLLLEHHDLSAPAAEAMLKEFLERRWRGIRPVLEGPQARELALTHAIYAGQFGFIDPGGSS